MSRVLNDEIALYDTAWSMGGYGDFSPGEKYAHVFASLVPPGGTVLDAGTGSGKGAIALDALGFKVAMCDVTPEGLDSPDLVKRFPYTNASLWHDKSLKTVAYMAKCFDPAFNGQDFDWAFCCDVMEHIPTQFTMLIIQNLLHIVQRGVFLSIALVPDSFGVWVGKPLHQTVQPFTWWRDNLAELATVSDARDCLNTGIFLLTK